MQAPVHSTHWRSLNVPVRLPERSSVPVLRLELAPGRDGTPVLPPCAPDTVTGAAVRARRTLILAVCCLSLFMVGLDNTIVMVGLPSIGRDLHAGVAGLQWMVAAYTITLAALLMFSGALADRIGRRTIFQVGLSAVHPRLVAVQPGPRPGLADRLPDPAGDRRLNAQPGRAGHHHQYLHRSGRAGPCDRRLGRRVRPVHGAGASAGRRAGRSGRLARDLLGQYPRRLGRHLPDRAVRARLQGATVSPRRPGRPVPHHYPARLARLRDHRGSRLRLAVTADLGRLRAVRDRAGRAACLRAASCRADGGLPVLPQRAVRWRQPHRGLRHRRDGRVPLPVHPLPSGRAGPFRHCRPA